MVIKLVSMTPVAAARPSWTSRSPLRRRPALAQVPPEIERAEPEQSADERGASHPEEAVL